MSDRSAFELDVVSVRLVKDAPLIGGRKIEHTWDAVALIGEFLCDMDRECVYALFLKTDGTPICCHLVSIGSLNQSIVNPRELFKVGILCNAANFILLHNHPSGDLMPSRDDTLITDTLISLGSIMGMPLLDHIIVGGDNSRFFSFLEKDILPKPKIPLRSDYTELDFNRLDCDIWSRDRGSLTNISLTEMKVAESSGTFKGNEKTSMRKE